MDRCAWSDTDDAALWEECAAEAEAQTQVDAADAQATLEEGYGGNAVIRPPRTDDEHKCFIDRDEIVTPAPQDIVDDVFGVGVATSEGEDDLPAGLSAYVLDGLDPVDAANMLLDTDLPASPRYVLLPSPRWAFGPGGAPLPADGAVVADQGTLLPAGAGTVAIIDTGVPTTPPPDGPSSWKELLHLGDEANEPASLEPDFAGHGVFIAGIVRRLQPNATITVRSAMITDGSKAVFDEHSVLAAVDAALAAELEGGGVVNLSLGTYACTPRQIPLELAARIGGIVVSAQDVAFVAAAGNDAHQPDDPPLWPAGFADTGAIADAVAHFDLNEMEKWSNADEVAEFVASMQALAANRVVVGVGALVMDNGSWIPAEFSNQPAATVWAPGANIVSNHPGWDGFAQWDGTSFAAPHVAALIASCHQNSGYGPALSDVVANGAC
jgi:subtilisin family serine protease